MAQSTIGKVTHYYPKIGVAVIDLSAGLAAGDQITFSGSTQFSQTVSSMQVEHASIGSAKKGDTIGLKVDLPVKPGDTLVKA